MYERLKQQCRRALKMFLYLTLSPFGGSVREQQQQNTQGVTVPSSQYRSRKNARKQEGERTGLTRSYLNKSACPLNLLRKIILKMKLSSLKPSKGLFLSRVLSSKCSFYRGERRHPGIENSKCHELLTPSPTAPIQMSILS